MLWHNDSLGSEWERLRVWPGTAADPSSAWAWAKPEMNVLEFPVQESSNAEMRAFHGLDLRPSDSQMTLCIVHRMAHPADIVS